MLLPSDKGKTYSLPISFVYSEMGLGDVSITKTLPKIENTLPLIFDMIDNAAYFDIDYGKVSLTEPKMSVKMEYVCLDKELKILGSLSLKTIFKIHSRHTKIACFQLFHECVVRLIDEYLALFKESGVINYPLDKIAAPRFDQILPVLRTLFGHE